MHGKFSVDFVVPKVQRGDVIVTATNAVAESASAMFTVINTPPVATDVQTITEEDTATDITLTASDKNGDPLTFAIHENPHGGVLSGSPSRGTVTYAPNSNFSGPDSFTFKASDGSADSNTATVTITVGSSNDPPMTADQSVTVNEDEQTSIALAASDPDNDPLTFSVVAGPSRGALTGSGSNLAYKPQDNYFGYDSFTFKANDGRLDSNVSVVNIFVAAVDDPPSVGSVSATIIEGHSAAVTLTANDVDSDSVVFAISGAPDHGRLDAVMQTGLMSATVVYHPNPDYSGSDSFTFKASDGSLDSSVATASLAIEAAASPPQNVPPAPAPAPVPIREEPQPPSSRQVDLSDTLATQDTVSPDATIVPSAPAEPETPQAEIASATGNENPPASLPSMWLVTGALVGTGAVGAFLAYRRIRAQKPAEVQKEPTVPPQPEPATHQTAVMNEARRVFSLLSDERSKAARNHVFEVAFAGAPADARYESNRALLKEQFGQISRSVMSDPLLNAMFLDSFAEVAIKVWRALAKEEPGSPDLEPVAALGREAEKYWAEHDREPIVI